MKTKSEKQKTQKQILEKILKESKKQTKLLLFLAGRELQSVSSADVACQGMLRAEKELIDSE